MSIIERRSGFDRDDFPHIALSAFLQRILNYWAGFIRRQYGPGRKYVDIPVSYRNMRYPAELKLRGVTAGEESVVQAPGHMEKCGSSAGRPIISGRACG
ncbi:MAG: hypothetical protein LBQ79_04765 [Deltaproteobacteria bacterium]|jgi:hypothetical protein|nr:hypothetical protein [Deltaproteobacteria bacterium]